MPFRRWVISAGYAIEGVLHAAKTQRHLRYHLTAALLVLLLAFAMGITRTEFILVSLAVILVLLAEMLNTAIEATVDILSPGISEKARVAKDVAAGGVLITSFGAAVIGAILLYPYLKLYFDLGVDVAKHAEEDIAILALVLVLITVVLLKTKFGKGRPLSGGMPSGHSALAFSVWVSITYITENFFASFLSFIMAVTVAESRVKKEVHRPSEVAAGALVGAAITYALFRLFS